MAENVAKYQSVEIAQCANGWLVRPAGYLDSGRYADWSNSVHVFNDAHDLAKHVQNWAEFKNA